MSRLGVLVASEQKTGFRRITCILHEVSVAVKHLAWILSIIACNLTDVNSKIDLLICKNASKGSNQCWIGTTYGMC